MIEIALYSLVVLSLIQLLFVITFYVHYMEHYRRLKYALITAQDAVGCATTTIHQLRIRRKQLKAAIQNYAEAALENAKQEFDSKIEYPHTWSKVHNSDVEVQVSEVEWDDCDRVLNCVLDVQRTWLKDTDIVITPIIYYKGECRNTASTEATNV